MVENDNGLSVMSLKVVTGYTPVPISTRRPDEYRALGARLLSLPVDIDFHSDTKLEDCWLWRAAVKSSARVPWSNNPSKNTLEFFCVAHQKTEWLERSQMNNPGIDTFVWIDYGVFHLSGVTEQIILDFLAAVERNKPKTIEAPGCVPFSDSIVHTIPHWRFCGGVLVCPATLVEPFSSAVKQATEDYTKSSGLVTWEVNTWAMAEQQKTVPVRQYHAGAHNHQIFVAYQGHDSGELRGAQ